MKRKYKKEQHKGFQACFPLTIVVVAPVGQSQPLSAHPSSTAACLGKGILSPVLRCQLPQVPPGRAHTCSPHPHKASVTSCKYKLPSGQWLHTHESVEKSNIQQHEQSISVKSSSTGEIAERNLQRFD